LKTENTPGQYVGPGKHRQYLVAKSWTHCFVGSRETNVRWVLEIGVGVIAGQVMKAGHCRNMHRSEIQDIQAEIDDNDIVKNYATEHAGDVLLIHELPEWARDQEQVSVEAALLLMADGDLVHTFTIALGFQGCNIDRDDLEARIATAGIAWVSQKCGLKHDLMIVDQGSELFIECDPGRIADRRVAMRLGENWPEKHATRTVSQQQSELASTTLRQLWSHQRARNEFCSVLTLRMSDCAETLVGWIVARSSTALRASHPFTKETAGWVIQRERSFDDSNRHRRQLKVSPESQVIEEFAT